MFSVSLSNAAQQAIAQLKGVQRGSVVGGSVGQYAPEALLAAARAVALLKSQAESAGNSLEAQTIVALRPLAVAVYNETRSLCSWIERGSLALETQASVGSPDSSGAVQLSFQQSLHVALSMRHDSCAALTALSRPASKQLLLEAARCWGRVGAAWQQAATAISGAEATAAANHEHFLTFHQQAAAAFGHALASLADCGGPEVVVRALAPGDAEAVVTALLESALGKARSEWRLHLASNAAATASAGGSKSVAPSYLYADAALESLRSAATLLPAAESFAVAASGHGGSSDNSFSSGATGFTMPSAVNESALMTSSSSASHGADSDVSPASLLVLVAERSRVVAALRASAAHFLDQQDFNRAQQWLLEAIEVGQGGSLCFYPPEETVAALCNHITQLQTQLGQLHYQQQQQQQQQSSSSSSSSGLAMQQLQIQQQLQQLQQQQGRYRRAQVLQARLCVGEMMTSLALATMEGHQATTSSSLASHEADAGTDAASTASAATAVIAKVEGLLKQALALANATATTSASSPTSIMDAPAPAGGIEGGPLVKSLLARCCFLKGDFQAALKHACSLIDGANATATATAAGDAAAADASSPDFPLILTVCRVAAANTRCGAEALSLYSRAAKRLGHSSPYAMTALRLDLLAQLACYGNSSNNSNSGQQPQVDVLLSKVVEDHAQGRVVVTATHLPLVRGMLAHRAQECFLLAGNNTTTASSADAAALFKASEQWCKRELSLLSSPHTADPAQCFTLSSTATSASTMALVPKRKAQLATQLAVCCMRQLALEATSAAGNDTTSRQQLADAAVQWAAEAIAYEGQQQPQHEAAASSSPSTVESLYLHFKAITLATSAGTTTMTGASASGPADPRLEASFSLLLAHPSCSPAVLVAAVDDLLHDSNNNSNSAVNDGSRAKMACVCLERLLSGPAASASAGSAGSDASDSSAKVSPLALLQTLMGLYLRLDNSNSSAPGSATATATVDSLSSSSLSRLASFIESLGKRAADQQHSAKAGDGGSNASGSSAAAGITAAAAGSLSLRHGPLGLGGDLSRWQWLLSTTWELAAVADSRRATADGAIMVSVSIRLWQALQAWVDLYLQAFPFANKPTAGASDAASSDGSLAGDASAAALRRHGAHCQLLTLKAVAAALVSTRSLAALMAADTSASTLSAAASAGTPPPPPILEAVKIARAACIAALSHLQRHKMMALAGAGPSSSHEAAAASTAATTTTTPFAAALERAVLVDSWQLLPLVYCPANTNASADGMASAEPSNTGLSLPKALVAVGTSLITTTGSSSSSSSAMAAVLTSLLTCNVMPLLSCTEVGARAAVTAAAEAAAESGASSTAHKELSTLVTSLCGGASSSPSAAASADLPPLAPEHYLHLASLLKAAYSTHAMSPSLSSPLVQQCMTAAVDAYASTMRWRRRLRAELADAVAHLSTPTSAATTANDTTGALGLLLDVETGDYPKAASLCRALLHLAPTRFDCLPILERVNKLVQASLNASAALMGASSSLSSSSSPALQAYRWSRSVFPLDHLDYAACLAWNHGVALLRLALPTKAERFMAWAMGVVPALRALSSVGQGTSSSITSGSSSGSVVCLANADSMARQYERLRASLAMQPLQQMPVQQLQQVVVRPPVAVPAPPAAAIITAPVPVPVLQGPPPLAPMLQQREAPAAIAPPVPAAAATNAVADAVTMAALPAPAPAPAAPLEKGAVSASARGASPGGVGMDMDVGDDDNDAGNNKQQPTSTSDDSGMSEGGAGNTSNGNSSNLEVISGDRGVEGHGYRPSTASLFDAALGTSTIQGAAPTAPVLTGISKKQEQEQDVSSMTMMEVDASTSSNKNTSDGSGTSVVVDIVEANGSSPITDGKEGFPAAGAGGAAAGSKHMALGSTDNDDDERLIVDD